VSRPVANRSHTKLTASLVALVLGMAMLTAASVPLYDMFCRITGYGGTTQVANAAPTAVSQRRMQVRFNTDVEKRLPWSFVADEQQVMVQVGEERLTSFTARNDSDTPLYGTAIYNVTPHAAAEYFSKIQCFCFDSQLLEPGQEVHMPVSFFIDPQIEEDPYLKDLQTVTLSYTFFLSKNQNDETSAMPAGAGEASAQ
jgi:cytochrome c oxidase assembly protein subunit 11